MPVELVKCGWCLRDAYPNELRHSRKLGAMVCPKCDADNDRTLGEIVEEKKETAKGQAWREGRGWAV